MTLTVRLPQPLDAHLDAYCAAHGLTKSHVVQESLAIYLAQAQAEAPGRKMPAAVSPAYAAFKRAGLVGSQHLGQASATRDVVRERMAARLKRAG